MFYGIAKMNEEIGELQESIAALEASKALGRLAQLIGKTIAFPSGEHPDGKGELRARLLEELADVRAATTYFAIMNFSDEECAAIYQRSNEKVQKFKRWGLTGIPSTPVDAAPESEGNE